MKTCHIGNQLKTLSVQKYIALAILALVTPFAVRAAPLGTAFTYHGRLMDLGNAANGAYDLQFAVYDSAPSGGGNRIGIVITNGAVAVADGLFATLLDFGTNVFTGSARWLDIGVRSNGSVAAFTMLAPRQPLTPEPYALYAPTAGTAMLAATATMASGVSPGVVTGAGMQDGTLTAAKFASGQIVKSLNGLSDNITLSAGSNVTLTTNGSSLQLSSSGGATSGWALGGNGGTTSANFLGTINNQALELRVNNFRGLRLEPTGDSPNAIGGASVNSVSAGMQGATIGGGGSLSTYGAPYPNQIFAFHGTIGGGLGNTIRSNALESTIAGGNQNVIASGAARSAIGGGYDNTVTGNGGFIGGGAVNRANDDYGTIGGGLNNTVSSGHATVAGGLLNNAGAPDAVIGGGQNNTVGAGASTIAGGQYHSIAFGAVNACIGGGYGNYISASGISATISGGSHNEAYFPAATIGGGQSNTVGAGASTISGGQNHQIDAGAVNAVIGGGYNNHISASGISATIPGGSGNTAQGLGSFAAGQNAHANHDGSFVWGDGGGPAASGGPNRFDVRATGGVGFFVSGGSVTIDPAGTLSTKVLTITGGADVAEPFNMSGVDIAKGSVVVIDEANPGHLKISERPYDTRVAGIVSGANGINPGISLSQQGIVEGGENVALSGRAYVLADASGGAIRPGDLLTTSAAPGYAMKVTDQAKAQGAILGKAMSGLNTGKGMVLALVTLQ